jgi:Pyruvate/2-oxoacid:ferredoxin oxidoreductase delta subunit
MELGSPDASGRPKPVPIKGSEFMISVDTVIAAVGQVSEVEFVRQLGLLLSKRGMIEISPETAATSLEGVFAGGDSAGGKAFVADAIASGKIGALAISCFLEGKDFRREFENLQMGTRPSFSFQHFVDPLEKHSVDLKQVVSFDRINTLFFRQSARNHNPDQLEPEKSIKTFKEVTSGLAPARMEDEISRCFKCGTCIDCENCLDFCPDVSILKDARLGLYGFDEDHCKGCGICSVACPRNIVEMVNENENVSNR